MNQENVDEDESPVTLTQSSIVVHEAHRNEQSKEGSQKNIVILIWDLVMDDNLKLLTDILTKKSPYASFIPVSGCSEELLKSVSDRSSHIIVYYSMKFQKSLEDLMSFLKNHGQETVNVIIFDLEDSTSAQKLENDWGLADGLCFPLLTITKSELKAMRESQNPQEPRKKENSILQILQHARKSRANGNAFKSRLKIRIFSRSHRDDFSWLESLLRSEKFGDQVESIEEFCISNDGWSSFKTHVSSCTFAILHHSMTRGRINVTNVAGALYDKELQHLNDHLGRDKVIVVIDDVEDNSDQEKSWILNTQPSIRTLAQELFLFSKVEKATDSKMFPPSFKEKMKRLEAMILGNTEIRSDIEEGMESFESPPAEIPSRFESSTKAPNDGQVAGPAFPEPNFTDNKPSASRQIEKPLNDCEKMLETPLGDRHSTASTEIQTRNDGQHRIQRLSQDWFSVELSSWNWLSSRKNEPTPPHQPLNDHQKMMMKTAEGVQRSTAATGNQRGNGKQHYIQKSSQGPIEDLLSQFSWMHDVGVFSISSEEDYSWMVNLITPRVKKVHRCYIAHEGFLRFMDDVRRCKYGIIYHTITRGRMNISNVADALYDRHLKYMSTKLGKEYVTVVIDDLEDSSKQQRDQILKDQPSIGKFARNLILISKQQKMMYRAKAESKRLRHTT